MLSSSPMNDYGQTWTGYQSPAVTNNLLATTRVKKDNFASKMTSFLATNYPKQSLGDSRGVDN